MGTTVNFDLGTIFAKGREHFLKHGHDAKIELSDHDNSSTLYARGQMIRGEIILLDSRKSKEEELHLQHENKNGNKIRGMKITLSGIENAFAQGFQRTNTIEKYEKIWP